MSIEEYTVFSGEHTDDRCCECGTQEDLTFDMDGNCICTDCLFEKRTEELEP